ncbi:MAG: DinB family protein [Planctomycetes bacterium]|nr:DinB family protein [Planctomycetota bacterium]
MLKDGLINKLDTTRVFFLNSTDVLEEEDSLFAPAEEMFSVAQQFAHTAQSNDWFLDGMLGNDGFDMDFEAHQEKVMAYTSLEKARQWLEDSFAQAKDRIVACNDEFLLERLAEGPIMGGVPRYIIIGALADHCAHHRGSLAVYCRLIGKIPPMPYGEAPE